MISSVSLCYSCIVSPAYFHSLPQKFITQQLAVVAQPHKVTRPHSPSLPHRTQTIRGSLLLCTPVVLYKQKSAAYWEEKILLLPTRAGLRLLQLLHTPFDEVLEFQHHNWADKYIFKHIMRVPTFQSNSSNDTFKQLRQKKEKNQRNLKSPLPALKAESLQSITTSFRRNWRQRETVTSKT